MPWEYLSASFLYSLFKDVWAWGRRRERTNSPATARPDMLERIQPKRSELKGSENEELKRPEKEELKGSGNEERIFIPAHITLDDLRNFYRGRTQIEGDRLISPYINKWITVKGRVNEISPFYSHLNNKCRVSWTGFGKDASLTIIDGPLTINECDFRLEWKNRIELLRKGDVITVEGKIESVDQTRVRLDDCALI